MDNVYKFSHYTQGKAVIRSDEEMSLLFEISQILTNFIDLRDAAEPVLKVLSERLYFVSGALTLLSESSDEMWMDVAHGLDEKQIKRGRYRVGEGITGKVVKEGLAAIVPKVSEEPLFLNKTRAIDELKKEDVSFICVPIKIGSDTIGALSANRLFEPEISLNEDLRLLTIIASLIAGAARLRQITIEEKRALEEENKRLQIELKSRYRPDNIIGKSSRMQGVFDLISRVKDTESTILIRGESGVGKELVASAIHYDSPRFQKPFVKVNCAALPESILESELFGHEKGAFTGAINQRKGRFELADGGTIFLDEIGDFSPTAQVKLLRVLQEKEFERVGGFETLKVDVRIIAATNRNLEEMMEKGTFRQDLYYRLNVLAVNVPPLRERKTDITLLTDFFVQKYSQLHQKDIKRISTPAIDTLMTYHWPGNVRELENCIERAVLLSANQVIQNYHLPPSLQSSSSSDTSNVGSLQDRVELYEKELIIECLKENNGVMSKAARALQMTERLMGLRVKKYEIDLSLFKQK